MSEKFLLDRILEPGSLSVRFQPVVDVSAEKSSPHYLEALIRGPKGTSAETPSILFEYARNKNKESLVDRACVRTILDEARALPAESVVGINIHASTLAMDGRFVDFLADRLEENGLPPARLVVEIVEHAPPWDVRGFQAALEGLRRLGARIALDDVGLGHSNYMMILECRPDYFKVDRHFVEGCHRDFHRRAVLSSVAQLARPFGARVVGEGVEVAADLATLKELGITLCQGYLLARPVAVGLVSGGPRPETHLAEGRASEGRPRRSDASASS